VSESDITKIRNRVAELERKVDDAVRLVRAACGSDGGLAIATPLRLDNAERQLANVAAAVEALAKRILTLEKSR
jgi:tetrahydromethanopterin S-methyltransferase subunit G